MSQLIVGKDFIGLSGGAIIINDNNEVLLIRRGPKARNDIGKWERPGGTVEFGEKIEEMIKREVMEEIGVEVGDLSLLGYTDHFLDKGQRHWVSFGFSAKIVKGEPKIMEKDKHDKISWFHINDLPENIAQPTKEGIEEYRKRYEFTKS